MANFFVGLIILFVVFLATLLGTLMGALSGWIVGLFFDDVILTTLMRFGVDVANLSMWKLGALLGFVSGFFRSIPQASD